MTADHMKGIEEADLWKIADDLRANSGLASKGCAGFQVWRFAQTKLTRSFVLESSVFGAPPKTTGPWFGQPFDASRFSINPAGTGTNTFDDASHATFSYTFNGISGSRAIERMQF